MILLGEVFHAAVENNGEKRRKVDFHARSKIFLLLDHPHKYQQKHFVGEELFEKM